MKRETSYFDVCGNKTKEGHIPLSSFYTSHPYSGNLRLAFNAVKWFFLLTTGFVISCLVSVAFQAHQIVDLLIQIALPCLTPLAVLTLCLTLTAVVLESLK